MSKYVVLCCGSAPIAWIDDERPRGRVRIHSQDQLHYDSCPDPGETLTILVAELHRRTDHPDYDMTRGGQLISRGAHRGNASRDELPWISPPGPIGCGRS
jgi:hypothetical protein